MSHPDHHDRSFDPSIQLIVEFAAHGFLYLLLVGVTSRVVAILEPRLVPAPIDVLVVVAFWAGAVGGLLGFFLSIASSLRYQLVTLIVGSCGGSLMVSLLAQWVSPHAYFDWIRAIQTSQLAAIGLIAFGVVHLWCRTKERTVLTAYGFHILAAPLAYVIALIVVFTHPSQWIPWVTALAARISGP